MNSRSKLIESAITKIVRRVMNESSQPEEVWSGSGWTISKYKNRANTWSLSVQNKSGFIDYPIYYDHNGKIAYDYPERVPTAIKKKVEKLYPTLKSESKVNNKNLTEAKSGLNLALPNCNLFVKGWGLDKNGNMRIIVGFPNDKGFPIQTNGTLPRTNAAIRNANEGSIRSELPTIGKEVLAYVQKYGPATVKNRLKVYGE